MRPSNLSADDAGRAVALLGNDHFGLAVRRAPYSSLPLVVFRELIGLARHWHVGLAPQIIILAVDEEDDVGVLLDRARFAQVRELRPLVLALLDRAAELRQADDRHIEFLGELLQAAADLRNFLDAILVARSCPVP